MLASRELVSDIAGGTIWEYFFPFLFLVATSLLWYLSHTWVQYDHIVLCP